MCQLPAALSHFNTCVSDSVPMETPEIAPRLLPATESMRSDSTLAMDCAAAEIALSAEVICALFAAMADSAPATEAARDVCCAERATTAAEMALSAEVICAELTDTADMIDVCAAEFAVESVATAALNTEKAFEVGSTEPPAPPVASVALCQLPAALSHFSTCVSDSVPIETPEIPPRLLPATESMRSDSTLPMDCAAAEMALSAEVICAELAAIALVWFDANAPTTDTACEIALSAEVICAEFTDTADMIDVCAAEFAVESAATAAEMALSADVICAEFTDTADITLTKALRAFADTADNSVDVTLAATVSMSSRPAAVSTFHPCPSTYCIVSPASSVYSIRSAPFVPS